MNQTPPQTTTTTQPNPSHTPSWEVYWDTTPEAFPQFTLYREDGERMATAYVSEANAQLIAQAPSLLAENAALREALAEMLPIFDAFTQDELSLTTINEAIALLPKVRSLLAK